MRLDGVRLENFSPFAERSVTLSERFNLIVGNNAAGKTSLLNGVAVGLGSLFLGFPSPAVARGIERHEVRRVFYETGTSPTVEAQLPVTVSCHGTLDGNQGTWSRGLTSLDGKTTRQDANWIRDIAVDMHKRVQNGAPAILPLISYYTSARLWRQMRQREIKTLTPDSRFMGYLDCLEPASDAKRLLRWFKTQEIAAIQEGRVSGVLEACRRAVVACIPDAEAAYFDIRRNALLISLPGSVLPFSYLSDGFRNMVAMAADIAVRCATLNPHLETAAAMQTPGVVLIDEIDLHLHPKWQRRVVNDLLDAFPALQFICTTHSPFIIQSLPPEDGISLINLDNPVASDFVDKSVEDISEEVQGVELPQRSRRWNEMMATAEKYYALLRQAKTAKRDEIERLKVQLDQLSLPFSDDPAYQALLKSERIAAGLDHGGV